MDQTNYIHPHERFAALIDTLGYTQVSFAQAIGISQGYVSQLMTGQRTITTKILQSIARLRPEVSTGWVLTGEGEMFLATREALNKVEEEPPAYLQNGGGMLESLIRRLEELERWRDEIEGRKKG